MSTLLAEEKHTPGPWFVLKKDSACIEAPSGNVAVANLARMSNADVRLIAAAPDLLQALKAIKERCASLSIHCTDQETGEPFYTAICAAISKAEGRT